MEEIVYLLVRFACVCYILYKVWGMKKKVREVCNLLYVLAPSDKAKKKEPEVVLQELVSESDVMGGTRFVYLDENAGETVAPYMSEPLGTATDYIEEEDIPEEEVECNLALEKIKTLKEEQEDLDEISPEVDGVSQTVTLADLDNVGDVLFKLNDADKDYEKSRRAAFTLHAIRETDLFEVFSSQIENKSVVENLMGKYFDEEGNPLSVRKEKKDDSSGRDWRKLI